MNAKMKMVSKLVMESKRSIDIVKKGNKRESHPIVMDGESLYCFNVNVNYDEKLTLNRNIDLLCRRVIAELMQSGKTIVSYRII